MNTASRMESTGMRGKIHISGETAELLRAEGKEQWFEPREGKVFVKGKGEMQTYWLHTSLGAGTMSIGEMTLGEVNNGKDSVLGRCLSLRRPCSLHFLHRGLPP